MAGQVEGDARRRAKGGMSQRTSEDENPISAGESTDVLDLVDAHARHVATQLPRGQLGTQAAESFLAAISGAVRLRLADVTGTAASIVELFVAHGLLPVLPNAKVSRAIPRLLAPLTPLVEARSARLWTLWLTALQDSRSPLVAKLRKTTPAAAFAVRSPAPAARVQTQRALLAERDALAARVVALQAEHADLTTQLAARADEHARTAAERDALATQLAAQQAEGTEFRRQLAALSDTHRQLTAERDALAAQLAAREAERTAGTPAELAEPSELERVAEFYEEQLRQAEARAAGLERHAHAAAELAALQAFLRESLQGQQQLTLFAVQRAAQPQKPRP